MLDEIVENERLINEYVVLSNNIIDKLLRKIKELELQIKKAKDEEPSIPKENKNKQLYDYIKEKINQIQNMIDNITKLSLSKENTDKFEQIKTSFNEFIEEFKNITENTDNTSYVEKINKIYELLVKLNENLGKVRVFLRIRPLPDGDKVPIEINGNSLTMTCNDEKTLGGPYYKIIPEEVTNGSKEFNKIVDDIKKELDSSSLCLFGYGLSGSGKTHTMLGNGGILQEIIKKYGQITVKYVFEQYVDEFVVTHHGPEYNKLKSISGKIIDYYNKKVEFINITDIAEISKKIDTTNITGFLDKIKTFRIEKNRIKKTPNNDESSRSTLYIVFEISEKVHLIIVDCAGRETPREIKNTLIKLETEEIHISQILTYEPPDNLDPLVNGIKRKDIKTLTNINNSVTSFEKYKELTERQNKNREPKFKYEFKEDLLNYLQSMFKEGYYINESLNHLIFFLNKKIDSEHKAPKTQKCVEQCGKNDKGEYQYNYDPLKVFKDPSKADDPIKTMTIMNWIETKYNPKYMMFCMIRQENDKCIDSAATLNFANSIKST